MNKNYKFFILFSLFCVAGCNQIQNDFNNVVKDTTRIDFYDAKSTGEPYKSINNPKIIKALIKEIRFGKKIPGIEMRLGKAMVFITPKQSLMLAFGIGRLRCLKGDYKCSDELLDYLNKISVKTEKNGVKY